MTEPDPSHPSPARLISHPLPVAVLFLLVLNAHLLKHVGWLPGWLTGKLSDFAGLFFFPILLVSITCALTRRWPARLHLATCLATGTSFSAIKLLAPVNELVLRYWGLMVMDPTDLIALVMLPLAARFLCSQRLASAAPAPTPHHKRLSRLDLYAILVASLATIATPAEPPPIYGVARAYPAWRFVAPTERAWVRHHLDLGRALR